MRSKTLSLALSLSLLGAALATGTTPMPELPSASGQGALAPWGGDVPGRWRPEAIMANAASALLDEMWALPGARDVIVAMPVKMLQSDFREFGDGQANAAPTFNSWSQPTPPLVAALVHLNSAPDEVYFRFDASMAFTTNQFVVSYSVNGSPTTVALTSTQLASGAYAVEWSPPANLGWSSLFSTQAILIRPSNWADWFPVWFRMPVRPIPELLATVPASMQTFQDGGSIVDHERMSDAANPNDGTTPYQRLQAHSFSQGYNQMPFNPADIHAKFPWNGTDIVTGVGRGWTWVCDKPQAPFKVMYTAFERRRRDWESTAPDGGVPSGGGWHRIGDPAETILNDLESQPLAVGSCMANPYTDPLPSGTFSYGLTECVAIRFLQPGEAFITPMGDAGHENFHWYFFQQDHEVVTEEWVHPWKPTGARFDFSAPAATTNVSFSATNAATSWGTSVYLTGDCDALGNWDLTRAVKLSATSYPTWTDTVALPAGTTVHFKFVKMSDDRSSVVWQSGDNRSVSTTSGSFSGDF
jgi:hypothetical protein